MSKVNFLGVSIEALTYQDMFNRADLWLKDKNSRSHHIACVNAYCVTLTLKNDRLRKIYNNADITGPDGMPFVRWMRLVNRKNSDRFYAPDILLQFVKRAKEVPYSFYLYGGSPDVVAKMKESLLIQYPYLNIVGYYSPPFRELTKDEDNKLVEKLNKLKPDLLIVGLGTPKQDYWISNHLEKIKGTIMIASGATFDFFGGRIKMAPLIIQKSGFEWLYRLFSKDFMRLWKRYTIFNIVFLWYFFLQITGIKRFNLSD